MKRRWVRAASLVGAGAALLTTAAVAASPGAETAVVRLERAFVNHWSFGCHGDSCQGGPLPFPAIEVATPETAEEVDVVVSVTMDYRTSRGDHGLVQGAYAEEGGPRKDMRPGSFNLNSDGALTSTTLSWTARNLVGMGTAYDFSLLALPRRGPGDDRFTFSGHKFTVVIEMWAGT